MAEPRMWINRGARRPASSSSRFYCLSGEVGISVISPSLALRAESRGGPETLLTRGPRLSIPPIELDRNPHSNQGTPVRGEAPRTHRYWWNPQPLRIRTLDSGPLCVYHTNATVGVLRARRVASHPKRRPSLSVPGSMRGSTQSFPIGSVTGRTPIRRTK